MITLPPETERMLLTVAREHGRDPLDLLVELVTKELDAQDADPARKAAFIERLRNRDAPKP